MKIDNATVNEKYLAYFAHIALAIPNQADRDYDRIRAMAVAHTLSYFGPKNHYAVSRILKGMVEAYRIRSAIV